MRDLGELIKQAREARKASTGKALTQEELGDIINVSKQWISSVERGKRLPSLALLVQLHEILVGVNDPNSQGSLGVWLLSWLEKQVQGDISSEDRRRTIQEVIENAAGSIQPVTSFRQNLRPTLENFPDAFQPLTIVCGDRRESEPKTRGDIFANSVSTSDLTFLLNLGLPSNVIIRSDKPFVFMGEDFLQREFGNTNLLVIGSPAVNLAARIINNQSVFRFNLPQWLKEKDSQIRKSKEPTNPDLEAFWHLAQSPADTKVALDSSPANNHRREELIKRLLQKARITSTDADRVAHLATIVNQILESMTAESLIAAFSRGGLVDFSEAAIHGMSFRQDNDFALISLAPNPFARSPDFMSIMVAGIHGPGTAHALKALAEDDFHEHPFGGIIEVELDTVADWPSRFQQASWRWQTKGYSAGELLAQLNSILAQPDDTMPREYERLTDTEINDCIRFVEYILEGGKAE